MTVKPSIRILVALGLTCLFSLPGIANSNPDLNQQMGKMAQSVKQLYPIILESESMKSAGQLNDNEITQLKEVIKDLQQHLEPLEAVFEKRTETRRITLNTIIEHLQQAENALNNNRQDYAINLLRSTTSLCMACHTQDNTLRSLGTNKLVTFKTRFANAEFLYMTRSYPEALAAFQDYIQQRGQASYDKQSIDALNHILVIYIQILDQPEEAMQYFSLLLKNNKLAKNLSQDVELWLKGLQELPALTHKQQVDYQGLKNLAKEHIFQHSNQSAPIHIQEQQRPFYIWLRGSLYNFADHKANTEQMPTLLYWLAISDRVLEYRFFYSLADLYLKQCIIAYSDTPVAKQCYQEYENYITFAYSGSGGTHIPDDIQAELNALKQMLP